MSSKSDVENTSDQAEISPPERRMKDEG